MSTTGSLVVTVCTGSSGAAAPAPGRAWGVAVGVGRAGSSASGAARLPFRSNDAQSPSFQDCACSTARALGVKSRVALASRRGPGRRRMVGESTHRLARKAKEASSSASWRMGPRLGDEVGVGVGLAVTVTLPVTVSEGEGGVEGEGAAEAALEAEALLEGCWEVVAGREAVGVPLPGTCEALDASEALSQALACALLLLEGQCEALAAATDAVASEAEGGLLGGGGAE